MRAAAIILGLLVSPVIGGCHQKGQRSPGSPIPLRQFVLYDMAEWRYGQALWAGEDGKAVVQLIVAPPQGRSGQWEKRYELKLTADQWAEVERLVGTHHFLALSEQRPRGQDDLRPAITVVTKGGRTARVAKRGGEKLPDFDPLYFYLLKICREVEEQKPVHEGAFDGEWRPEGFGRPW